MESSLSLHTLVRNTRCRSCTIAMSLSFIVDEKSKLPFFSRQKENLRFENYGSTLYNDVI